MYPESTVESQDQPAQIANPRSTGAEHTTDPTCLERTYMVLREQGLATPDELRRLAAVGQEPLLQDRQQDPLELLVSIRISDSEQRPAEIERMGRAMSQMMERPLVLVPFANRLPTPTAFYDTYPTIYGLCQELMTPVVFAEESEVIGIASINPVALMLLEDHVTRTLSEITGTRPIVTQLLAAHEVWESICRKQLEK
jgi:hypothetical protein